MEKFGMEPPAVTNAVHDCKQKLAQAKRGRVYMTKRVLQYSTSPHRCDCEGFVPGRRRNNGAVARHAEQPWLRRPAPRHHPHRACRATMLARQRVSAAARRVARPSAHQQARPIRILRLGLTAGGTRYERAARDVGLSVARRGQN